MEHIDSKSHEKHLCCSSNPKSYNDGDLHTDGFLIEFFPELKIPEVHTFTKDSKETQQEDNMMNGHRSLIDDLTIQNEKLKLLNKELKEKSIHQESQIAKYEIDLSEKMQDVFTANQELETTKVKYQKLNKEKEKLDKDLTQLKVQVDQLLDTREKNNQANQAILDLQKDLLSKEKTQRKLKIEIETASQKVVEKNGQLRKMKSAFKKIWNLIVEMSETLSKNGLLTAKRKEQILKEIDDQISSSDLGPEGENIKAFLCGLNTVSASETVESSNGADLGNKAQINNSAELVSPFGSSTERLPSHHSAIINASAENCVTSNIKSSAENSVTSNLRSSGTNYFMRTHKDVIEDLVFEDYNELNNFRQQLSVRNDPISPLPPTPPPKNAKLLKSEPSKSSIFTGKKLNFFHQQSESFEVQNVDHVEKPPLMISPTCTTPTLSSPSPYTISSKLNHDGSLKLDFSANYDTHLSFDMNTRKVSCTVMPSTHIQIDDSSVKCSPSLTSDPPISSTASQVTERLSNQSPHLPVKSNCLETVANKYDSTSGAVMKKIGPDFVNNETLRNPKKIKLHSDNNDSKKNQKPSSSVNLSSPKQSEKASLEMQQNNFLPEREVPFNIKNSSHEKKTLNEIGRSGKICSAFVSPSEKRITIPSVRVSPRQLKVISSNLECEEKPMEIDNHLESSAAIHDKILQSDGKSTNKRKKRLKRLKNTKNSKDMLLFSSSKNENEKKNKNVLKKRKMRGFKDEKRNALLDDTNKCSDINNEDKSESFQHTQSCNSNLKLDSPNHLRLQENSLSSNIQKELLNVSSPEEKTSDQFKVPCAINGVTEKVKISIANEEEKLPNDDESSEAENLLTQQIDGKLNNDIDFSDIQVGPFNPSTFVSRGLFEDKSLHLESIQKSNIIGDKTDLSSLQVDSLQMTNELEPSIPESPFKDSSNTDFNYNVTVPDEAMENKQILSNSDDVLNIVTNGDVASALNNDGLDSDHSLIIAEDLEHIIAASDYSGSSPNKSEVITRKKRFKKKPNIKKSPGKKKVSSETVKAVTIAAAFGSLEQMKYNDMHFKQNQHTLVNAFINPNNAAGTKDAVYQILKYLASSRANPFIPYEATENEIVLCPMAEKCIVQALFQISKKRKSHLHGLLESIIITAHELIIAKESFQIYGLSALCRVLTEICRCLNDKIRPLMLCSELLRIQHKFAPYLIASVAGVWKELFSVDNVSDEEAIFHSSIVYGTQKKPTALNEQQWKNCSKVLSQYLSAQFPYQINEMVAFLVQTIENKCKGSLKNEFILTTPLIVFTVVEGWNWAKEFLIDKHILPLLVTFSEKEVNEKAFAIFCQLYADICYFCPNEEPHEVFGEFYNNNELNKGNELVKHAAAMAQMKLIFHKKQLLPEHLTEWINQIQHRADYVEYAEKLCHRRLMNDAPDFLVSEIL